jgi:dTMP kinase
MNDSPGILITLDGPGGVGKTTTLTLIHEALREAGLPVHATTQPSRTSLGELIRKGTHTYRGMALACLVAGDRHHQVETEIQPALAAGDIVICDRYLPSSLVLQRMDGLSAEQIWCLNAGIRVPDLAVVLNGDPAEIAARLHARGKHSRFESTTSPDGRSSSETESDLYHLAVLELRQRGWPVHGVDCTRKPPETIARHLADAITALYVERSPQCLT